MATYYARLSGNINASNIWATTPTGTAGAVTLVSSDILIANSFTVTVNVDTTVAEVRNDNTGGATAGGTFSLNNSITLRANAYSGSTGSPCLSSGSGNVTIVGNIICSIGPGVSLSSGGIVNITGSVTGGISSSTHCITPPSNSTINITGNVNGGSGSSAHGIYVSQFCTINIIGNCIGGSAFITHAINIASNSVVNITGNVIGSDISSGNGVSQAAGTLNLIGNAIGGNSAVGLALGGSSTAFIKRAKGNNFGLGSSISTGIVGVSNSSSSPVYVEEIEYGDLGQSPTSGPIYLTNKTSNVCLVYRPGLSKKTLISADSTANLLPSTSDVRSGVYYNYSNNIGTMNVPNAANVALGVAVDNTTGTAVLNVNDIWNIQTSGLNTSGSIGERLANCSTVATAGQQLASALTTFN